MLSRLTKLVDRIRKTEALTIKIDKNLNDQIQAQSIDDKSSRILLGKLLVEANKQKKSIRSLEEVEFQVFSQFGDDGIIQYIISQIDFPAKTFVEFGVETYKESNTRFLLINNNWSGMVMDGSESNINFIKGDAISFYHEICARQVFISKENINQLLQKFPFGNEIGLLSIDIDGNDWYVWKEITVINPILVIVEYNSVFGHDNPWTIPYDANYIRTLQSADVLLYGTSLLSLCDLAEEKGYFFVGCNSAGNNAYFIRKDKIGSFKPLSASQGYVKSKFSEYFDVEKQSRVWGDDRLHVLNGKTVYNTRTNAIEKINISQSI